MTATGRLLGSAATTGQGTMDEPTAKDLKYLRFASGGARIFSTCSRGQFMAVVLDAQGFVSGVGYNGAAHGLMHCIDDPSACPRASADEQCAGYTDCISVHAEQNALVHSRGGVYMAVNGTPCFTCSKLIANSGIRRLVFLHDAPREWPKSAAYLEAAGVEVVLVEEL